MIWQKPSCTNRKIAIITQFFRNKYFPVNLSLSFWRFMFQLRAMTGGLQTTIRTTLFNSYHGPTMAVLSNDHTLSFLRSFSLLLLLLFNDPVFRCTLIVAIPKILSTTLPSLSLCRSPWLSTSALKSGVSWLSVMCLPPPPLPSCLRTEPPCLPSTCFRCSNRVFA